MSTINDGGTVHPTYAGLGDILCEGITVRDYFAAKAMVMSFGPADSSITYEEMAKHCYAMADAMLRAREGGAS